ncbi:hypothetical protein [Gloeothece verrucosa]|uniref:CemA family protein n=1 Tax=Gloeothece verrucosa (strain PCC 7822) TaxID=497965 RepID=E0UCA2_GLOV7|nr:hypothetical protein [Gloeothece verrucosa]ADN12859.1 CemA family protein [Gloeothece verrucosa PCC 7822]
MKSPSWLNRLNQWVNQGALDALDKAYSGAKTIKMFEEQYFEGNKIAPDAQKGKTLDDYFQSLLERELLQIRWHLSRFRLGNFYHPIHLGEHSAQESKILERLNFIESVIGKYRHSSETGVISQSDFSLSKTSSLKPSKLTLKTDSSVPSPWLNISEKLSSEYEQQVVQQLRNLRQERKIALRFLVLLIVVPILAQVISKNFIYSPFINEKFVDNVTLEKIEISQELTEKFLSEFSRYKEGIEIKSLLGIIPELSQEKKQELLREKAIEIGKEKAYETLNGWKNMLSDLTSLAVFTGMIYIFRPQFTILRSFISRYFLGLSDITKVFLFILLTDMFVGFHSAEGWEVILATAFEHFGLPENRNFIFLFIATIPVILDSTFKLLIFNFFTRKSPTAVALLEKMQQ